MNIYLPTNLRSGVLFVITLALLIFLGCPPPHEHFSYRGGPGRPGLSAPTSLENRQVWHLKVEGEILAPTAATASTVIVGTTADRIMLLDLSSGNITTSFPTTGDITGDAAVDGFIAYVGGMDGKIYSINTRSHRLEWQKDIGTPIAAPLAVTKSSLYAADIKGRISRLDRRGKMTWQADLGSPIYAGMEVESNSLFIATYSGKLVCLDNRSGKPLWDYTSAGELVAAPCMIDNLILIVDRLGNVSALDATGKGQLWTVSLKRAVEANPAAKGDRVLVASLEGRVTCLALSDGKVIWTNDLGSSVQGGIAIWATQAFLTTEDGKLWGLALDDGAKIFNANLQGEAITAPTLTPLGILVGLTDGTVELIK